MTAFNRIGDQLRLTLCQQDADGVDADLVIGLGLSQGEQIGVAVADVELLDQREELRLAFQRIEDAVQRGLLGGVLRDVKALQTVESLGVDEFRFCRIAKVLEREVA